MSKEFTETKRKLGPQYPFDRFMLENDDYQLNIYYMGEYENDKANHSLDPQKFVIDAKLKPKSTCLELLINKTEEILIRTYSIDYLSPEEIDKSIESLKKTKENIKYIRSAIDKYALYD